ncbi:MAG: GTPase HflX [Anaerolineae bacterium]|nr:GTPase HflX [Anaerolineae bacterium]
MSNTFPAGLAAERGFLVGVEVYNVPSTLNVEDSLEELALLADTAGVQVIGQTSQNLSRIDPATFIGSGKAEEIKLLIEELDINTVIFDDELSPRHQRELEKLFGENVKVLDRSALILDIFAQHARTREGALQVELAQYEYRLPRLTRQWEHLARQAGGAAGRAGTGGAGLRGPGETQLETDRQDIRRRIARLKRELEDVRAHRARHRKQRAREGIPVAALVGYTNAGKSTLLNALTDAGVYVADRLFATLDPTTRRITLPGGREILITDTVGFIQKLPTTLVVAFRATLEEIGEADLLLHVVDVTHPNAQEQAETVEETLAEINVQGQPILVILNKIDLLDSSEIAAIEQEWAQEYGQVVSVSARSGQGLDELAARLETMLASTLSIVEVEIPYARGDLFAEVKRAGTIVYEEHTETGFRLRARVDEQLSALLEPFRSDIDHDAEASVSQEDAP